MPRIRILTREQLIAAGMRPSGWGVDSFDYPAGTSATAVMRFGDGHPLGEVVEATPVGEHGAPGEMRYVHPTTGASRRIAPPAYELVADEAATPEPRIPLNWRDQRVDHFRVGDRVRVCTRAELEARGWTYDGHDFRHPDVWDCMNDVMTRYLGRETTIRWVGGSLRVECDPSNYAWYPGMLVLLDVPVAPPAPTVPASIRIRTIEEALAAGCEMDADGFTSPGGMWMGVSEVRRLGGTTHSVEDLDSTTYGAAGLCFRVGDHWWAPEAYELLDSSGAVIGSTESAADRLARLARIADEVRRQDEERAEQEKKRSEEKRVADERRRRETGAAMAVFRDAPRIRSYDLITCGFELETQETEGETWDTANDARGGLDEDAYADAVNNRVSEILGDVTDYVRDRSLRERVREAVQQRVIDRGDIDEDDYRSESGGAEDYMRDQYSIPHDVEVGEDGSVRGFEFRTRGARSYMQFLRSAKKLLRLDHTVDTGCSFHIHLGVKGVKHSWGERMQSALVEYLVENIDRVPESVRDRWAGIHENNYINRIVAKGEKYTFVHAHPQGTWEFRCFGNIDTYADAVTCLNLAIEAMQFAYKVLDGKAKLVRDATGLDARGFSEAVKGALADGKTLTAYLATDAGGVDIAA